MFHVQLVFVFLLSESCAILMSELFRNVDIIKGSVSKSRLLPSWVLSAVESIEFFHMRTATIDPYLMNMR